MNLDVGLDYAPDADITTAGVVTDCSAFVPTTSGYIGAPAPANVGMATLAADCRGAAATVLLDNTTRLFAGTQTKLYERSGLTWTDVSAGTYTGGAENRWRFAQWGNSTIATNYVDAMQVSTSSGAFSALAGTPPKAAGVFTVGDFLMYFDYDDGTAYPDGWGVSGIGNIEEHDTTDVATQAARGRLLDLPGQIRAGGRLGKQAVLYKENGLWLGTYQGPPTVWSWQLVPGNAGCVSQEALVEVTVNGGNAHLFLGEDDIYLFDGSRPVSIATNKVRTFYQNNASHQYRYKSMASHDRLNAVIRFYFVSKNGGTTEPDMCLVYNYRTNQWGRDDREIHSALQYITASISWDDLGTYYSTWDDLPAVAYNSPFWSAAQETPAIFDTSNDLQSLTGASTASSFTTGYLGDQNDYTTVQRTRLKYNGVTTATGTATHLFLHELGESDTTGMTVTLDGNKFDLLCSARWHKFQIDLAGDYKVTGLNFTYEVDGDE